MPSYFFVKKLSSSKYHFLNVPYDEILLIVDS